MDLGPTCSPIVHDWFQDMIQNMCLFEHRLISRDVISWSFSKIFLLNISLINTYKMPPRLPSHLIRVLRYKGQNIQIFPILHVFAIAFHTQFLYANEAVTSLRAHLHMKILEAPCQPGSQ